MNKIQNFQLKIILYETNFKPLPNTTIHINTTNPRKTHKPKTLNTSAHAKNPNPQP